MGQRPLMPQKGALDTMGRDVFISYANQDVQTAETVLTYLEREGITCWIAPRDVGPGEEFDQAILDGIDCSGAVVVVLSNSSNVSRFVQAEVNRAFARGKTIFTLRIENVIPSRQLELYLARRQWLDGFPPPIDQKLNRLVSAVKSLLGYNHERTRPSAQRTVPEDPGYSPRFSTYVTLCGNDLQSHLNAYPRLDDRAFRLHTFRLFFTSGNGFFEKVETDLLAAVSTPSDGRKAREVLEWLRSYKEYDATHLSPLEPFAKSGDTRITPFGQEQREVLDAVISRLEEGLSLFKT